MAEITDFNFTEDDFTAADLAKFELIKSEEVEALNNLAELLNHIVAAKVAKLSQAKNEYYSQQLALKEVELDTFYNHSPCGYFSTDGNGIINKINDTLLVWLGYAKEDIIGKITWQSLLSVGGQMYVETHYSPLLQMQGFVKEISFEMVKKDKTRLPILINTKQIRDENGKVQVNYSTVFDVSQRKSYEKELLIAKRTAEEQNKLINETNEKLLASEKELIELNNNYLAVNEKLKNNIEEVKILNENLHELNATKDKFFSIIAHDLKNPFNTLLGFSELLVKNAHKYTPEKVQQFAQNMNDSSQQAFNLLENLLEWARLQTGSIKANRVKIKPSDLVNEVTSLTEQMAKSKNIDLQSIINFDNFVFADKEMINTVLRNLVSNALKFTQSGGIVKIETETKGENMLFTISDTGFGIEPEHIDKLFRIDNKLSKTGTKNETGTGLGLILCKDFVEKNNGTIWVESELGKGSHFKFTLPLFND